MGDFTICFVVPNEKRNGLIIAALVSETDDMLFID
jgi:hypothetical protein